MTNFIPIFPLELIVYPSEKCNLHVFEDRYKQLIDECYKNKKPFGLPSVIKNKISENGTLMQVTNIVKKYSDGKMDITTTGVSVYRILEIVDSIPSKLYSGAIVKHLNNDENGASKHVQKIIDGIRELHRLLHVQKEFSKPDAELRSYDIAHHAGLSIEEEYELLCLLREEQRMEYLRRHLKKTIPVAAGIENLKKKIQLNGHFKELKGFDPNI